MRLRVLLPAFLLLFLPACRENEETDIIEQNFENSLKIQLPGNVAGAVTTRDVDVNLDGHPDYAIRIEKYPKDEVYYQEEAFYMSIAGLPADADETNPFSPVVIIDLSATARKVGQVAVWNMAKFFQTGDSPADSDGTSRAALLSKTDEFETIQPLGVHFVYFTMSGERGPYHGWMQIELEESAVTVRRTVFCTTANKVIKAGQM